MHPIDRRLLRECVLAACGAWIALAAGIPLLVDRIPPLWARPSALGVALGPLAGALGAATGLRWASQRGELRVLALSGQSPLRSAVIPMGVGWAFGLLAVIALLVPLVDPVSLFPAPVGDERWRPVTGAFVELRSGVQVPASGWPSYGPATGLRSLLPDNPRLAAILFVLPQALTLPLWVALPLTRSSRIAGTLAAIVVGLVSLQAVASGRWPSVALALAALPLMLQSVVYGWRSRRETP